MSAARVALSASLAYSEGQEHRLACQRQKIDDLMVENREMRERLAEFERLATRDNVPGTAKAVDPMQAEPENGAVRRDGPHFVSSYHEF